MKKTTLLLASLSLVLLAACGQKDTPAPAAAPEQSQAPAAAEPAPAPAAENTVGKSVFGKTCALCHAAGVAGAPKPGDKADWGPRIAQGNDILFKHASEGFTGAKGMMPARGGNSALTDDEVKSAIAFMVDQSR